MLDASVDFCYYHPQFVADVGDRQRRRLDDIGVSVKVGRCRPDPSYCPGSMTGRRLGESFGTIARKGVVTSWARLALNAITLLTLPLILEESRPCGM